MSERGTGGNGMTGPRRWLGYLGLVIVFAAACGLLSWWQFSRNAEAQERIREVSDNWDAAPQPIGDFLAAPDAAFDQRDTWSPVAETVHYDAAHQLLVRGRPNDVDGSVGFEILDPLVIDGGGILIVDRGWVPEGEDQASVPDSVPPVPSGEVTVVARLKTGEPSIPGRTAPAGQVGTIDLSLVAAQTGLDGVYTGAYGLLASESPAGPTPTLMVKPQPDPGPFLSYAIQWILFAVMAAVALSWSVWNERRIRRLDAEAEAAGLPKPVPVKRRRVGDTDSAEEDALLDAPSSR